MKYRLVSEQEFVERMKQVLSKCMHYYLGNFRCVLGAGRSGAIASAYASHLLGIPYMLPNVPVPKRLHPILIIDTAEWHGRTLRKLEKRHGGKRITGTVALYKEPPMVYFWYETMGEFEAKTEFTADK